jgi:hypothetical protein
LPLCIGRRARRQAGSRDCPGIHHRVRRPVAGPLDAHNRIKRQPGTVHPEFLARLVFSDDLTNLGEHEGLGRALDGKLILRVPSREGDSGGPDNAHSEQVTRYLGKSRNVVSILPLINGRESFVRLSYQRTHTFGRWQVAG